MNQAGFSRPGPREHEIASPYAARLASAARSATPALLFGLRLWAAVCLALYVAFWLQLDNAQWAGTSAAIVCQPPLGASLRKGSFRVIGTVIGAVAIVVLTACFPQGRTGVPPWPGAVGRRLRLLRDDLAQLHVLCGGAGRLYGGDHRERPARCDQGRERRLCFLLAIDRATAISIGIVCAGIVLAGDRLRRRAAAAGRSLSPQLPRKSPADLAGTFSLVGPDLPATRPVRRELIARVVALEPIIEEAIGESPDCAITCPSCSTAVDGLFAALSGWRTVAISLERLPNEQGRREADCVLRSLPQALRLATTRGDAAIWAREPSMMLPTLQSRSASLGWRFRRARRRYG